MSGTPKSPQAQVRFRDGDDLVEFEGSKKAPSESKKETTEADPASRAKAKVRKATKKSEDTADGITAPAVKSRKASASASEDESIKGRNQDQPAKSAAASTVKPPQPPPPPPPVRKLSININTEDAPRPNSIDRKEELKLKYYSAFQTINRVHGGAIMKIKVGTAGSSPTKDSFPIFGVGKKFTCLHWDAECTPADWCLAYHSDTPEWFTRSLAAVGDVSASSEYVSQTITSGPTLVESSLFPLPSLTRAIKVVKLSHITDIYVDSTSIKLYCDREVVHLTPVSAYNPLARKPSCWADAVYSAQHLLQETPEYVMLYKTEFVSILAQHTLGDTRTVEVPQAPGQIPSESQGSNNSSSTSTSLLAPLSPSRPGMLRRRSTLSAFFGVGASKPLSFDDEVDPTTTNNTNSNTSTNNNTTSTHNPDSADATPENASPRRKMSLLGAVKMVRGALKRSVSAPQSVFSAHKLERSTSGDSHGSGGGANASSSANSGSRKNSVSSDSGRERSQSVHSVQSEHSQSTFLSQNALSTLFNTGIVIPDTSDTTHTPVVDILPQRSLPDALQMQIHALQEENKLLQQTLVDNNIRSPSLDLTESVHSLQITPTNTTNTNTTTTSMNTNNTTYNTVATSPYTSDTEHTTHSTKHPTHTTTQDKAYTTKELSTLRAFTARSNYHQNNSTVKNTTRAFASNTNNTNITHHTNTAHHTNTNTLTPLHVHSHYGPGSRPPPAPVAHVLGKQTVLDLLLAQTPVEGTASTTYTNTSTSAGGSSSNASIRRSAITRTNTTNNTSTNNNSTSVRKQTLLHTIGDDYYNDTIELEPQQIVQLVELHKLQQEHARRTQLGISTNTSMSSGDTSPGVVGGSGGVVSSVVGGGARTTSRSTSPKPVTTNIYSATTGTSVVPALRMDHNDCAVPVLETYLTYDSDVYDNTHTTYPYTQYTASSGGTGDDLVGKRVLRDSTSPIPRTASSNSGSGSGSASSSAIDLQAIVASSGLLPTKPVVSTGSAITSTSGGNGTSKANSTLGAGIQSGARNAPTAHDASTTHTPLHPTHPVIDFITSDNPPPGQVRTTLKEQQARRSKVVVPVGQSLLQSMHTNTTSTTHPTTTNTAHNKPSKANTQAQLAASAQREQKLLSILSGTPPTTHPTHTTHTTHTTYATHNTNSANVHALSSDEEHKSSTYRSRNNSTTSNSDHHTAPNTTSHSAPNTAHNASHPVADTNDTNATSHRRNISPQRKGYLARMANTSSAGGVSSSVDSGTGGGGSGGARVDKKRGSVLGSGLLTHHTEHTTHTTHTAHTSSNTHNTNIPNNSSTNTTRISRDRSYSADNSDHHEFTTTVKHSTRPNNSNAAHAHYTTTEASDSDTLHYLKTPQWSNSYYYHGKHSPSKSKKSRLSTEKDTKIPPFSPEKESKMPAAEVKGTSSGALIGNSNTVAEYTRIITALCTDGALKCGLFHRTQLTVFVSALHCSVHFAGEHGVVAYTSGLFKQDHHFLLLQSEADVLIVPLSGVAAAELDTNNTGLFKLSFTNATTRRNKPAIPTLSSTAMPSGGVIGKLIADLSSAASTGTATSTTSSGAVSLVLKAEDTLALVDWLTVLLDLKYVPAK